MTDLSSSTRQLVRGCASCLCASGEGSRDWLNVEWDQECGLQTVAELEVCSLAPSGDWLEAGFAWQDGLESRNASQEGKYLCLGSTCVEAFYDRIML